MATWSLTMTPKHSTPNRWRTIRLDARKLPEEDVRSKLQLISMSEDLLNSAPSSSGNNIF